MTKDTLLLCQRDDGSDLAFVPAMPDVSEIGTTPDAAWRDSRPVRQTGTSDRGARS